MAKAIKATLVVIFLLAVGPLNAKSKLHLDGGITFINMTAVKKDYEDRVKATKAAGGNGEVTENYSTIFVDLGLDFALNDSLNLGPQVGYMLGTGGSMKTTGPGVSDSSEISVSPAIVPFTLNFGWQPPMPEKGVYYGADLGVGYSMLMMTGKYHVNNSVFNASIETAYSGFAPIVEAEGHLGYTWGTFSAGLLLGYRYNYFAAPKLETSTLSGTGNATTLVDGNGSPLDVDVSGLKLGLNLVLAL